MRSFIAIPLPESLRTAVDHTTETLRKKSEQPGIRWTRSAQLHLTLRFLGNVDDTSTEALIAVIRNACNAFRSFQVHLKGLGCFPNADRPRVLWFGIEGTLAPLIRLQAAVAESSASFGDQHETSRFKPHLTIARVRNPDRRTLRSIKQMLTAYAEKSFGNWRINEVLLMKSDLTQSGAVHSTVERFPLPSSPKNEPD